MPLVSGLPGPVHVLVPHGRGLPETVLTNLLLGVHLFHAVSSHCTNDLMLMMLSTTAVERVAAATRSIQLLNIGKQASISLHALSCMGKHLLERVVVQCSTNNIVQVDVAPRVVGALELAPEHGHQHVGLDLIDEVAQLADELEAAVDGVLDDEGDDADDELEHVNLLIQISIDIGSTKRFQYAEKRGVGVFLFQETRLPPYLSLLSNPHILYYFRYKADQSRISIYFFRIPKPLYIFFSFSAYIKGS